MSYEDGLEGEMAARGVMPKDLAQLNREVAEWLGLCWHQVQRGCEIYEVCSCGYAGQPRINRHIADNNPDFIQHPVELLRLMLKHNDWQLFGRTIGETLDDHEWNILVKYITDTTGLLLQKVGEWKELEK